MAEIDKLSVGKALEKLRGTKDAKSKAAVFDEKMDALDKEAQRLRALRLRIERDQKKSGKSE
jgi:hypothetical protein